MHFHGQRVILLVHGYDKGDNPSARQQQIEIKRAGKALAGWRRRVDIWVSTHMVFDVEAPRNEVP